MLCKIFRKVLKNRIQVENVKILTVFLEIIADMISNKTGNPVVTKLFIRGRKLKIQIVFITKSYFKAPKILN